MSQPRPHEQPKARRKVFWPITILAVAMLATLVTVGLALVAQFDKEATLREQKVVENGIMGRVNEVAALPRPQVIWDDAVRNLDNRFDPEWAKMNIGTYLTETDHFHGSYVLDAQDKPIFAFHEGKVAPPASYQQFAQDAKPLVAEVRRIEASRAAMAGKTSLGDPIQASGIVGEEGDIHILTATLVAPDFGKARINGPRAPVLITDMAVDGDFLAQFGTRFMLDGVHVHPGDSRLEPDEAHVALRDRAGRYVATLDWLPQKPGTALLKSVGVPALALICFLALSVLYFFLRGMRTTEGLILSEARAQHRALHDDMTGLPNRISFTQRLDQILSQMRPNDGAVAVLSIDLDGFEKIAATFGHRAADEYVEAAAKRMAQIRRPSDMLARFAADEFGLVMTKATPETASRLAARLCAAVAGTMELSCGNIFSGCSIGITVVSPGEGIAAFEALRRADLAMHRAKIDARGHFCLFESEMDAVVKTRRALEVDLRKALDEDALDLFYQPQVDRNGYVTGVEALVRWTHPERGPVSPGLFVPIAEECGLIMQLGMFTLHRAFEDSRRWPGLKIAVNVSAVQIMNERFLPRLTSLVQQMGVDPTQFELEITEGILINDDPVTQERLRELRDLGFALALDDFGTGYSSLSYLSRYPVNKIKIDRSFVTKLDKDAGATAVVSAIIRLARALKLSVIAEGVETNQQRGQLAKAGCFNIQGYLYSRPVSADEIDRIYADNARMIAASEPLAA